MQYRGCCCQVGCNPRRSPSLPFLFTEWQSAAEQLYDPKPLLSAEQHASAAALAERQRDGGKSVGLADCLEVGGN